MALASVHQGTVGLGEDDTIVVAHARQTLFGEQVMHLPSLKVWDRMTVIELGYTTRAGRVAFVTKDGRVFEDQGGHLVPTSIVRPHALKLLRGAIEDEEVRFGRLHLRRMPYVELLARIQIYPEYGLEMAI